MLTFHIQRIDTFRNNKNTTGHIAVFVALLLAVLVVYGNTFLNQWTYDDLPVIVNNPDSHSFSGFLENHRPGRPLRELTYIPEYKLFGEKPAGYHVQQLGWHWGCACLLFLVLSSLGVGPLYATMGALLFLSHPLQSETVANISHRKEILALFFLLASILSYLKAVCHRGAKRLCFSLMALGCYGIAMLANETALTFALIFPLYDYLFLSKAQRLILKKPYLYFAGLAVATILFCARYRWMFDSNLLLKIYSKNSFIASKSYFPLWMADLKAFLFYLYKIVVPINLAPEYNVQFSVDWFQAWACVGALTLIGMVWYALHVRNEMPQVTFGVGWFLILYLPVSNILPLSYILADRYMYLCLPGVALSAAFILQKTASVRLVPVGFVLIALISVLTIQQNGYWRDENTLWRHAVQVNPDSTWVQETVALSYLLADEFEKASWHAKEAIRLNRYNVRAYLTLAKSEDRLGNIKEALNYYKIFVKFGGFEYPLEVQDVANYIPFLEKRIFRNANGINATQKTN